LTNTPTTAAWHASTTTVAGRVLTVYARTGLPAGLTVTPAAELLAEYAATHPASRVLIIDAAFALPALVTAPTAAVAVAQRHAGMLVASQRTLTNAKRTGIDWLAYGDASAVAEGSMDLVLIEVAATRDAWLRRLCEGYRALAVGGILVAVGPNDAGGRTVARDVKELIGACNERSKSHQRMVVAKKPAHALPLPAWAQTVGIAIGTTQTVQHAGRTYQSAPGVFAHGRVDAGTAFLLEHFPPCKHQHVLDIGAGIGVLGGWALDHGAARVNMVEVDGAAAQAMTATFADIAAVHVSWSDVIDPLPWTQRYELVVANPPFHSGKRNDETLITQFATTAAKQLSTRGEFWCVANAFLAYQSVFAQVFEEVTKVASNGSFTIWRAKTVKKPE
jgi:16S rRNA (guanine1207-N2)-methyltransferase